MIWQVDLWLLLLVVLCAVGAIALRSLLSAVVAFSAYSFLMCLVWTEMGAVDVAFTEAVVGAGVSTIFFIAALFHTTAAPSVPSPNKPQHERHSFSFDVNSAMILAFAACLLTVLSTAEFPMWGSPDSQAATGVVAYYVENAVREIHVPNLVTAILGDYRGYDTMFELVVIFCAGICVTSILKQDKKNG